jgi:hypothetical protein
MMLRAIFLLIILASLLGCASPSPLYSGGKKGVIAIDELTYTVFFTDTSAQVIRTGLASPSRQAVVPSEMIYAVEQVTKCDVLEATLKGDSSIAEVELTC